MKRNMHNSVQGLGVVSDEIEAVWIILAIGAGKAMHSELYKIEREKPQRGSTNLHKLKKISHAYTTSYAPLLSHMHSLTA